MSVFEKPKDPPTVSQISFTPTDPDARRKMEPFMHLGVKEGSVQISVDEQTGKVNATITAVERDFHVRCMNFFRGLGYGNTSQTVES